MNKTISINTARREKEHSEELSKAERIKQEVTDQLVRHIESMSGMSDDAMRLIFLFEIVAMYIHSVGELKGAKL